MITYQIERKIKGTKTFFFPTVNGKRITGTNFARKYDAQNLINAFAKKFSEEKIIEMVSK